MCDLRPRFRCLSPLPTTEWRVASQRRNRRASPMFDCLPHNVGSCRGFALDSACDSHLGPALQIRDNIAAGASEAALVWQPAPRDDEVGLHLTSQFPKAPAQVLASNNSLMDEEAPSERCDVAVSCPRRTLAGLDPVAQTTPASPDPAATATCTSRGMRVAARQTRSSSAV